MKRLVPSLILLLVLAAAVRPVQGQDAVSDLLGRINGLRSQLELAPYALNPALTAAAQNHANWMAANSTASHIQDNGSRPRDRAQAAGYNSAWVSENIYIGGMAGVDSAWNFWVNSPVHYAGLTSPNYQDIGIATATGAGGQAFVLVFGTMSWGGAPAQSANTTTGGSGDRTGAAAAAAAPPSFVVGWDAFGNIMHEVQPGDTLGDIALFYGYTWEDIPTMLALNGMTEADIRALEVGSVFLVPPQSGTYTPTPGNPEETAEATAPAEVTAETSATQDDTGILPTPEATEQATASELLPPPAVFDATTPTSTPTPTSTTTPSPTATQPPVTAVAMSVQRSSPIVEETPPPASPATAPPLWLVTIIAVQLGILGYASYEFLRRR